MMMGFASSPSLYQVTPQGMASCALFRQAQAFVGKFLDVKSHGSEHVCLPFQ